LYSVVVISSSSSCLDSRLWGVQYVDNDEYDRHTTLVVAAVVVAMLIITTFIIRIVIILDQYRSIVRISSILCPLCCLLSTYTSTVFLLPILFSYWVVIVEYTIPTTVVLD